MGLYLDLFTYFLMWAYTTPPKPRIFLTGLHSCSLIFHFPCDTDGFKPGVKSAGITVTGSGESTQSIRDMTGAGRGESDSIRDTAWSGVDEETQAMSPPRS